MSGVLAGHSPVRPDHLGVSACALLQVAGLELTVQGLDASDGTPILDIKPHAAEFRRPTAVQPIDPDEVAARLVELTLGEPAGRVPDLAGPQVTSWAGLLRGYLRASHRRRWVVPVRIPGTRAVRADALLHKPARRGPPNVGAVLDREFAGRGTRRRPHGLNTGLPVDRSQAAARTSFTGHGAL